MTTLDQAHLVKELYKNRILALPGVVGVATGVKMISGSPTGQMSIVALVREKLPPGKLKPEEVVPGIMGGMSTDVLAVGELDALENRRERWRPAPGGISIGHLKATAGTLGCMVRDKNNWTSLALSNNHVLANMNDAQPGDAILQPAPADGGVPDLDLFGYLERFQPIRFGEPESSPTQRLPLSLQKTALRVSQRFKFKKMVETLTQTDPAHANLVDAAVARPAAEDQVLAEVLEIGKIENIASPALEMAVEKSGAVTGLTTGKILLLNATVVVNYQNGKTARFENQILTGGMAEGGDSGSILVSAGEHRLVGLLFAGSAAISIYSPAQSFFDLLEVQL